MKTKFFIVLFTLISIASLSAQDIITKKDGTELKVIIKEVTDNHIKYVDFRDPNGVVFTIDKVLISGVKFQYGQEVNIKDPEQNTLYYADDKINNIMFNFTSFAYNTLVFSYEKVVQPGRSWMLEAKIYGAGIKSEREISRSGFGLEYSYRLKTKSLFNYGAYRPKHLLHGAYFAPAIGFSTGKHSYGDLFYEDDISNTSHTVFHFGLYYGRQYVLQRILTVDASIGGQYYVGNEKHENTYEGEILRLGNMIGGDNFLFSMNIRIGFLTGKSRLKKK